VRVGEVLDATFADDGALYLADGDLIRVWREGRLTTLALPRDAPPPAGPVVWMP
jgi:hypothetical protein